MATIQIREVPEETYKVLCMRARIADQSLQGYLRQLLIGLAERPTKADAIAHAEKILSEMPGPGPTREQIVAAVHADRR